eukprot:TRINITY_DN7621_c0_g1_i2.p2 TRINITY_DN7621_c0_g1~~TRINITY_DN7621_c0_g1_i2.p2  ORF type:complete len:310 (+),score=74.59 TRINITY_DN7621_c0_g1_i2:58-987(+)
MGKAPAAQRQAKKHAPASSASTTARRVECATPAPAGHSAGAAVHGVRTLLSMMFVRPVALVVRYTVVKPTCFVGSLLMRPFKRAPQLAQPPVHTSKELAARYAAMERRIKELEAQVATLSAEAEACAANHGPLASAAPPAPPVHAAEPGPAPPPPPPPAPGAAPMWTSTPVAKRAPGAALADVTNTGGVRASGRKPPAAGAGGAGGKPPFMSPSADQLSLVRLRRTQDTPRSPGGTPLRPPRTPRTQSTTGSAGQFAGCDTTPDVIQQALRHKFRSIRSPEPVGRAAALAGGTTVSPVRLSPVRVDDSF